MAVGEALFQVLSRYGPSTVVQALAFPYHEGYESLLRRILPALRCLGIHLLLVSENRDVWHLGPQAPGFFPEKPSSLLEVLDVGG